MRRFTSIVLLPLVIAALTVTAEASCAQAVDVPGAQVRWAAARKSIAGSPQPTERCRAYDQYFYVAVVIRQAEATCQSGAARDRALEGLDAEIEAFNALIGSHCSWTRRFTSEGLEDERS